MLERVKESSYEIPPAFSPALARLLAEVTLPPGFWGPCWPPGLDVGVLTAHCPPSIPSCCATTPCAACATSTISKATPSSAGWPSTPTCCRRTRWRWRWPRAPSSSPHPIPPPSPTSTATSPSPRAGLGLAEPPWLGPPTSLRDNPPPPTPYPGSGSDPAGPGPSYPNAVPLPAGAINPRAAGTAVGAALTPAGESGTLRGVCGAGFPSSSLG